MSVPGAPSGRGPQDPLSRLLGTEATRRPRPEYRLRLRSELMQLPPSSAARPWHRPAIAPSPAWQALWLTAAATVVLLLVGALGLRMARGGAPGVEPDARRALEGPQTLTATSRPSGQGWLMGRASEPARAELPTLRPPDELSASATPWVSPVSAPVPLAAPATAKVPTARVAAPPAAPPVAGQHEKEEPRRARTSTTVAGSSPATSSPTATIGIAATDAVPPTSTPEPTSSGRPTTTPNPSPTAAP
jgi:hypothetical protein